MTRQRYMKQENFDYMAGLYTLAKLMNEKFDDQQMLVDHFFTAFDTTLKHFPSEDRKTLLQLINQASFSIEQIAEGLVKTLAKQRITQETIPVVKWLTDYLWSRALSRHSFKTRVRTIFLGYNKANYDEEKSYNRVKTCEKNYLGASPMFIVAAVGHQMVGGVDELKSRAMCESDAA